MARRSGEVLNPFEHVLACSERVRVASLGAAWPARFTEASLMRDVKSSA